MCPVLRPSRPTDELDRSGRLVLDHAGIPARAQVSAVDPTMAYLAILDGGLVPAADQWRHWMATMSASGFLRVRTGALTPRQAEQASRAGLTAVQELALLELVLIERPGPVRPRTQRLGRRRWETVAAIDRHAFGPTWFLDAAMLDDITRATPDHRARIVTGGSGRSGELLGFLLSGGADRMGYIQRLAVSPNAQRQGVATALVVDALRWMHRTEVTRVYVNTHIDNAAALELYRRHGFELLPDRLRVFEGSVT